MIIPVLRYQKWFFVDCFVGVRGAVEKDHFSHPGIRKPIDVKHVALHGSAATKGTN